MREGVEHSNDPKGYKEVYLGPKPVKIPSEWGVRTLDDLTTNSGNYGANTSAKEYDPEKPRYIRITDIGDDGFLKDDDIKSIQREEAEDYYLSEGDLLFARTGATAGKSYLCRDDDIDAAYAGYLIRFEIDESKVDKDFLALYVQSKFYENWVDRITRHGAQQNINASEYCSLEVVYPPIPEQRRISGIISLVDEQIQQTDDIIEEILELRHGLSSDLLKYGVDQEKTKSTPMGPVPSSWEIRRGKELTSLRNGKYISSDERLEEAEFPVYGGNGIMAQYDDWFVEPGTIIIGRVGAYCGNIHLTDSKAWVTDNAIVARINEDEANPYFLAEVFRRANLKRFASRSAQPRISQSVIETLSVPIPNKKEQEVIAEILSTVDKRLAQEREHKHYLQELKQGLMQDLLTGKIRVKTDT